MDFESLHSGWQNSSRWDAEMWGQQRVLVHIVVDGDGVVNLKYLHAKKWGDLIKMLQCMHQQHQITACPACSDFNEFTLGFSFAIFADFNR